MAQQAIVVVLLVYVQLDGWEMIKRWLSVFARVCISGWASGALQVAASHMEACWNELASTLLWQYGHTNIKVYTNALINCDFLHDKMIILVKNNFHGCVSNWFVFLWLYVCSWQWCLCQNVSMRSWDFFINAYRYPYRHVQPCLVNYKINN